MNPHWKRWAWRLTKIAIVVVMFVFIGRQFYDDLNTLMENPDEVPWRPGWLLACAGLYLVGLIPTMWFWRRLLYQFGYPMPWYACLRAHYVAQLGKYVPGKALAIMIRANLAHPFGVPYGVSIIATFYEVLTGMAGGAIIAALVYMVDPPEIGSHAAESTRGYHIDPMWVGLALIGVCGVPLLPSVFNLIVERLSRRIQAVQLYRLPPMRFGTLVIGLLAADVGWCLQGLSCWAILQATLPEPPPLTFSTWAQCTAAVSLATVLGFAIIIIPGGLMIREKLLSMVLSSYGPHRFLTLAAILLRIVWVATEAVSSLILYLCRPTAIQPMDANRESLGVNAPP